MVELVLIGAGGHCKSCIAVIESTGDFRIRGIVDKDLSKPKLLGYRIVVEDEIENFIRRGVQFLITIGQIENAIDRIRFFELIRAQGGKFPVIVSQKALCAESGEIGDGTIVMHNALINFDASIGENCIINTGAIVEHDCKIGNHCHISTGAVINGGCIIGDDCFIGSNSVLKQGISICEGVVIGAGSVVTRSIQEPGVYYGNPARKK